MRHQSAKFSALFCSKKFFSKLNSILANFSKVQSSKFCELLNIRKWRRGPPSSRSAVVSTTVCTELSATIAGLSKYQLPFLTVVVLYLFSEAGLQCPPRPSHTMDLHTLERSLLSSTVRFTVCERSYLSIVNDCWQYRPYSLPVPDETIAIK
jgi:hypothetical protein